MNTENESRKLEAGDQLGPLQMDNPGGRRVGGCSKAQLQTLSLSPALSASCQVHWDTLGPSLCYSKNAPDLFQGGGKIRKEALGSLEAKI